MDIEIELQVRDETFEQWYGQYFEELAENKKHNIRCSWEHAWAEASGRAYSLAQNKILRALVLDGILTQEFVDNLIKSVKEEECTDI